MFAPCIFTKEIFPLDKFLKILLNDSALRNLISSNDLMQATSEVFPILPIIAVTLSFLYRSS